MDKADSTMRSHTTGILVTWQESPAAVNALPVGTVMVFAMCRPAINIAASVGPLIGCGAAVLGRGTAHRRRASGRCGRTWFGVRPKSELSGPTLNPGECAGA